MNISPLRVTWLGRFITKLNPLSSIYPFGAHPAFPITTHCWRTPFKYARKVINYFSIENIQRIHYQGIKENDHLMTYLMFNRIWTADFGVAQYFTSDFQVARNYATQQRFVTMQSWFGPNSHTHTNISNGKSRKITRNGMSQDIIGTLIQILVRLTMMSILLRDVSSGIITQS